MNKPFVDIRPGVLISDESKNYEVTHTLSSNTVLARDIASGSVERLKIDKPHIKIGNAVQQPLKDMSEFSEKEWAEAKRRYAAIAELLKMSAFKRKQAKEAAALAKVNIATLYRWLNAYRQGGTLSSLIPSKPGPESGLILLGEDQEQIITATIEEVYMSTQRLTAQDVAEEVIRRCRTAGIRPPHANTVRRRISALKPSTVLNKRGMRDIARNLYQPIRGEFPGADFPLSIVQIDHSEADIILVEESTRLPIGRPWLTLAIDVFSRTIAGIFVSFERPSAVSVGMCIAHAILPKVEYLTNLNVPGEWPIWGKMGTVHADNAKEFRGNMLQRACQQYGIALEMRPVRAPHYGGHIERLMGTMANEIRKLPGTTFSSPTKRKGYNSEAKSAITLREFEQHIVEFIVNVYHKRIHSQIEMPPIRKWDLGIVGDGKTTGAGMPALPADPTRIKLDFMPFIERTVQPYGLVIDDIAYYSEVLNPWINSPDPEHRGDKRKFIVRRDPRDISCVYFYDSDAKEYYMIPYRNTQHPPMSLWELREVRKKLHEERGSQVDENAIFDALTRMRQRLDDAKHKTKSARRRLARVPTKKSTHAHPSIQKIPRSTVHNEMISGQRDDPFSKPVIPFEDLEVMK